MLEMFLFKFPDVDRDEMSGCYLEFEKVKVFAFPRITKPAFPHVSPPPHDA